VELRGFVANPINGGFAFISGEPSDMFSSRIVILGTKLFLGLMPDDTLNIATVAEIVHLIFFNRRLLRS
jgi:hypothetical protein